jgi:ribonucleotide monophosphatase NagD (HAD superfamily)
MQAFSKLVNPETKQFCIPTIFVTNAGNSLRQEKADKLSEWLNIPISEEQVSSYSSSVSDPHNLYADPDPAFFTNADPDPILDPDPNPG